MNTSENNRSPAFYGRLWARWGLDPNRGVIDGVSIEWADGAFVRVEASPRPPHDYPPAACYDAHLLTPGLLNAHAHLDWSFRRGALPRGVGFAPWLRAMIAANRGLMDEDMEMIQRACRQALAETIQSGVTEIWDIRSHGWGRQALIDSRVPAISFDEFLAPRRSGWLDQWERWVGRFAENCRFMEASPRHTVRPGVSPHSTYSLCPPALEQVAAFAREKGLPLAIHLAESPEENELLIEGRGALREAVGEMLGFDPLEDLGRGVSPIRRAHAAGALGPATLAIHANLPQPGEAQMLAESGAAVVFCPRSHAFFGYSPYPLDAYRRAGVRLALGTDSLASNDALDLREEVRAFAARATGLAPLEILAVASGAALGETPPFGRRGLLEPGRRAQWTLWRMASLPGESSIDALFDRWLAPATSLEPKNGRCWRRIDTRH